MIVISLGGSLIVPDDIDVDFLKKFKKLIEKISLKNRFAIICGGGRTARNYQESLSKIVRLKPVDIDWIGIHATRLNAHLLRALFYKIAYQRVIKNPTTPLSFKEKVLIAAGWEPGSSTDYDAVLLAKNLGARTVINLTNISYVYSKDPRRFPKAEPLKEVSWREFRKILPKKWRPGLNAPFDPIAARHAEKMGLEVIIMNGKNLKNLEKFLSGKAFVGTRIY